MKKPYVIDLIRDRNELEPYEIADKNLIEIKVQAPGDTDFKGIGYRVELTLSLDGMVGLGIALVRKALLAKERGLDEAEKFEHLRPGFVNKNMGVYLKPNSAELLITVKDFGTVEDVMNKLKAENKNLF